MEKQHLGPTAELLGTSGEGMLSAQGSFVPKQSEPVPGAWNVRVPVSPRLCLQLLSLQACGPCRNKEDRGLSLSNCVLASCKSTRFLVGQGLLMGSQAALFPVRVKAQGEAKAMELPGGGEEQSVCRLPLALVLAAGFLSTSGLPTISPDTLKQERIGPANPASCKHRCGGDVIGALT